MCDVSFDCVYKLNGTLQLQILLFKTFTNFYVHMKNIQQQKY